MLIMSLGKGLLYRSRYQYLQEYDLTCIIVKGQKMRKQGWSFRVNRVYSG